MYKELEQYRYSLLTTNHLNQIKWLRHSWRMKAQVPVVFFPGESWWNCSANYILKLFLAKNEEFFWECRDINLGPSFHELIQSTLITHRRSESCLSHPMSPREQVSKSASDVMHRCVWKMPFTEGDSIKHWMALPPDLWKLVKTRQIAGV